MDKEAIKANALKAFEGLSAAGYFLVIASIIYFILGAVTGLVGGEMLQWSFCGSFAKVTGINFCGYSPHTPWAWGNLFVHRFINAAIPWVTIIMGLVVLGVSLPAMNALGHKYDHRNNRD